MWKDRARTAMDWLVANGQPFTADDLLALVGHPDGAHKANGRNSAIGSLFAYYSRQRLIEPCGTVRSRDPHRKRGMVRVWKPL